MSIVSKIKHIRTLSGLSQSEFAKQIGFSQSAIAFWETGRKIPSLKAMIAIFDFARSKRIKIKRGEFFTL